ncbi:MAG: type II toxin-antitoxin system RelE family toxin [Wolbachia sp.]
MLSTQKTLLKYIFKSSKIIRARIANAINKRLITDPIKFGKSLRSRLKVYRRMRISDYRIIYTVNIVKHKMFVAAAGYRDSIYEKAKSTLNKL